jgi:hypothetical protein
MLLASLIVSWSINAALISARAPGGGGPGGIPATSVRDARVTDEGCHGNLIAPGGSESHGRGDPGMTGRGDPGHTGSPGGSHTGDPGMGPGGEDTSEPRE